jgi:DNA polymerase (family 10)
MAFNDDLSAMFRTMAAVLEIKGEPVFKAIAFSRVSRLLENLTDDIRQIHERGELANVEGIGASSRKIIEQYIATGKSDDYEQLIASVPEGLLPLLEIPSMGPKTIALLWKQRGITDLAQLTAAIDSGALLGLKGIGEKKIQSIKEGIALRAAAGQRRGIVEALPVGQALVERLRKMPQVRAAEVAGSLRRRRETIGDIDVICSTKRPQDADTIAAAFVAFPEVRKVLVQGPSKASVLTEGGLQVDLRITPADRFGATLLHFTGSKEHNVRVRGLALEKGLTLNDWGLFKLDEWEKANGEREPGICPPVEPVAAATEAEIYAKLGLAYIEPEMREDRGEVEAALAGKLPKLITLADIRGDLHTHTTASDGAASILEMAQAAKERGYEFLAITDHSKSQVIANGLSVERLMKHVAEIRKAAAKIKGITLLAGAEVDILSDGHLDYEDEVLKDLDIVVASPHVALKQDQDKATDRIVRAIENRWVTIIGHPTGRLIGSRAGLPLRYDRVFKAAADTGTVLEINAGYPRLDLNDSAARSAQEAGVKLSINTDAHSIEGLAAMADGIGVARRAWLTASDVINCLSAAKLLALVKAKRG